MRMAMKKKAWKANATMVAVCAGLAGVMCGCGDDTVGGTSGEAMTGGDASSDAASNPDSTVADSGSTPDTGTTPADATTDSAMTAADTGTGADVEIVDSSTHDTGVVDSSATDTGAKDAVADVAVADAKADASDAGTTTDSGVDSGVDAGQTLCDIFNNEYLVNGQVDIDEDINSWLSEVVNGPASGVLADGGQDDYGYPGSIGMTETVCAAGSIMTDVGDFNAYLNNMVAFEKRVFGCYDAVPYNASLGNGYAFAIIPKEYTGVLTKGDLDNAVAFYVQQANLVFQNHGVTITSQQLTEMTTLLQATESGYPNSTDASSSQTTPICANFDGGI